MLSVHAFGILIFIIYKKRGAFDIARTLRVCAGKAARTLRAAVVKRSYFAVKSYFAIVRSSLPHRLLSACEQRVHRQAPIPPL